MRRVKTCLVLRHWRPFPAAAGGKWCKAHIKLAPEQRPVAKDATREDSSRHTTGSRAAQNAERHRGAKADSGIKVSGVIDEYHEVRRLFWRAAGGDSRDRAGAGVSNHGVRYGQRW